jgi:nucleoside-diphosphate-sugar epimerase
LPLPNRLVQAGARAIAGLPFAPPVAEWAEAASRPAIMDTAKAKRELGWTPRYSGREALRATLRAMS